MFRIVILLSGSSGRGSNMACLANACRSGAIPNAAVVCVVGTHAASPAIERAKELGLTTRIVGNKTANFESALQDTLRDLQPDLICLAGYMRQIPADVLKAFDGKIVNIHPALLPSFGGKGMYGHHVHEAVIGHGCKISGCTVHYVDEGFDTGPIVLQKCIAVEDADTPEMLGAKVLALEHAAYPEAVGLIAQGRVRRVGRRVYIDPSRSGHPSD